MSGPCPTLDSLIELGFERRQSESGAETVGYSFVHLDLVAYHGKNRYFRDVVYLSGVLNTGRMPSTGVSTVLLRALSGELNPGRTLSIVESEIPTDLGSPLEAAAWISYALKSYRSELEPLPDWFVEGERYWDLVPPARMEREAHKRLRAYEACPKCFIDREYAVPLRRRLRTAFAQIVGETEMTFSFDGRVLSIALCDAIHEVVASGDSWPSSYQVVVSPETSLPARFTSSAVVVSVFEGYVCLDRLRLGPCKAVA